MKKKALASLLLALLLVFSSLPLFQAQAQTLPMKQELYQTVADDLRLWPIFPGDGDPGGAYPYTTTPKGTVFFVQEFKRYNNLLYGKTKPRYQYGDLQEYYEPLWINLAYSKNNQWVFEGSVPHQHNTNGMPATTFERFQKIPADRDEHEVMKVTTLRCTCRYLSNRMTYEHEAFEPHEWDGQRCTSCGYVAPEFAVLEIVRDPEQLTVGDYGSWTVNTNDPDHAKKYKFAVYREEEVIYLRCAPPQQQYLDIPLHGNRALLHLGGNHQGESCIKHQSPKPAYQSQSPKSGYEPGEMGLRPGQSPLLQLPAPQGAGG
ncbi:MAG: hypothetical protein GXY67_14615 [Clostridiales bacterium]|nr:hypothetical protein [Clostridiales bacterium]